MAGSQTAPAVRALVQRLVAAAVAPPETPGANTAPTGTAPPTITAEEVRAAAEEVMCGAASDAQVGGLLMALEAAPASGLVLGAFAEAMAAVAAPCVLPEAVAARGVDVVGTGGDGMDTFSVSTASSLVLAACGAAVAKHGNRSSSGRVGSADFLEALGARITLDGPQVAAVAGACGFGFLYAPAFHPAMRHVAGPRKQLGIRTVFNLLGPLSNPADPPFQVLGVSDRRHGELFARLLQARGRRHALVVHGADGVDEISPAGPTHVWEVRAGSPDIAAYTVAPADFGLPTHPLSEVRGGSAAERVAAFRSVLAGRPSAIRDFVVLNAAAGAYVAGLAPDLRQAAGLVQAALDDGRAADLVDRYVAQSQRFASSTAAAAAGSKADILTVITAQRRKDVAEARAARPLADLRAMLPGAPPQIDFPARLRASAPLAVMAEIKRASPSKGSIAPGVVAADQARLYAQSNAAAISVLTEPTWFKGTLQDMADARAAIEGLGPERRPAILRKDFLVDEYQLYEARVHGADTVLLIVAVLSDGELAGLMACARGLGMEPLVEVANAPEMQRALAAGARVIGVNNRNLRDFTVDTNTTKRVLVGAGVAAADAGFLLCALSGIATRMDVQRYRSVGCHAVLVGEALMRSASPPAMIAHLRGFGPDPLVKICGLKDVPTAEATVLAGADLIGLVFAPKSRRCVSVDTAKAIVAAVRALRSAGPGPDLDGWPAAAPGAAGEGPGGVLRARGKLLRAACAVRPLVVGVFANQPVAEVADIAERCGLDIIQLSGTEGMDAAKHFPGKVVIKAVHVGEGMTVDALHGALEARPLPDAILLDTKSASMMGGTGETFDWALAKAAQARVPLFLAGGLDPANIAGAVGLVRPFGVDISSGVETAGAKDLAKISAFIKAAKLA